MDWGVERFRQWCDGVVWDGEWPEEWPMPDQLKRLCRGKTPQVRVKISDPSDISDDGE